MKKLLTWLGLSLLLVTLVACSTANPSSTAKEEVPSPASLQLTALITQGPFLRIPNGLSAYPQAIPATSTN